MSKFDESPQLVKEKLESIYIDLDGGDVVKLIKELKEIMRRHPNHINFEFDLCYKGCYYSGDTPDNMIAGYRPETEKEIETRRHHWEQNLRLQAKQAKRAFDEAKALYESQKAKYEGTP